VQLQSAEPTVTSHSRFQSLVEALKLTSSLTYKVRCSPTLLPDCWRHQPTKRQDTVSPARIPLTKGGCIHLPTIHSLSQAFALSDHFQFILPRTWTIACVALHPIAVHSIPPSPAIINQQSRGPKTNSGGSAPTRPCFSNPGSVILARSNGLVNSASTGHGARLP
jgi:hypothetical protein